MAWFFRSAFLRCFDRRKSVSTLGLTFGRFQCYKRAYNVIQCIGYTKRKANFGSAIIQGTIWEVRGRVLQRNDVNMQLFGASISILNVKLVASGYLVPKKTSKLQKFSLTSRPCSSINFSKNMVENEMKFREYSFTILEKTALPQKWKMKLKSLFL